MPSRRDGRSDRWPMLSGELIRGNSYMLMMDRNNLQVAALIRQWLAKQGLYRRRRLDGDLQSGTSTEATGRSPHRLMLATQSLLLYKNTVIAAPRNRHAYEIQHRMDGNDLESGHRMHQAQRGLQTLLRRTDGEASEGHGQ